MNILILKNKENNQKVWSMDQLHQLPGSMLEILNFSTHATGICILTHVGNLYMKYEVHTHCRIICNEVRLEITEMSTSGKQRSTFTPQKKK
jgi:hypothetical protein